MSVPDKYKTVLQPAEAEIIEKKSRFIAAAAPIASEEEAQAFVLAVRKKHYNANHTIYAFTAGLDREILRYSDDGEPSGTAGMPVLNILTGAALRNTVVVVTRYFGGTLLGTGGLARAYTAAAKDALLSAKTVEKNRYAVIEAEIDYALSGKFEYETARLGHFIKDTVYAAGVTYTILVECGQAADFLAAVTELSGGSARADVRREVFGTKNGANVTIDEE
ncbi:MAG: IMPACT family protein [Clostridiales bacterium]|jgi:uncharacterized YigZ family protein|nr:IMPACT family protein [Clostridiales bacterium]